MSGTGTYTVEAGVGIILIDSPPVNALGFDVRVAITEGMSRFGSDPSVQAIVLMCGGRTFFAGADIAEFGKPPRAPDLRATCATVEDAQVPVVAAIHGTALGGGFELALNCHYRVAAKSAKVGLPEVNLGLLPGAGGTQRLPRLIGVEPALELIMTGRAVSADEALQLGAVDLVVPDGELRAQAVQFARRVVAEQRPLRRVRDRDDLVQQARSRLDLFDDYRRRNARLFKGPRAPDSILKAVRAAVELPFDAGMQLERELIVELIASTESAAQRYFFFAERATAKVPDIPDGVASLPIGRVGVIGAGTMGGGIAMNFLNAGIPVTLVETSREALDRGLATIRRNYESSAKRGKLTAQQVEERMELIAPSLQLAELGAVDLIIEAVFEEMAIKKEVFGKLDAIARHGAILASNTSYLDLDEIAGATTRPDHVIGLHFFSPANVMRLLEVVRGKKTSNEVVATAMKLARTIAKVPVLSRVCYGFIANRIMTQRSRQANSLILEGTSAQAIDAAITKFGFAMGPFQMMDLVGLDVIGRGDKERTLRSDLVQLGRLGQKKNGGFYDYDAQRNATPSPVAAEVVRSFAQFKGVQPRSPLDDEGIVYRLLSPVVNEGAKLLEEQIAIRASDIDVAAILGYNWPVYTGGPMFWADTVGLPKIVKTLQGLRDEAGTPLSISPLLLQLAGEGGALTRR